MPPSRMIPLMKRGWPDGGNGADENQRDRHADVTPGRRVSRPAAQAQVAPAGTPFKPGRLAPSATRAKLFIRFL